MYKHNAFSIKETNEKQFVSIEDKTRWNNKAESIHDHNDLYYTKEEIFVELNRIYKSYEDKRINTVSVPGFIKDIEIFGDSKQIRETNTTVLEIYNGTMNSGNGSVNYDDTNTNGFTDFIPIKFLDTISLYATIRNEPLSIIAAHIYYYDGNKKYLGYESGYISARNIDKIVLSNKNAQYIRLWVWKGDRNNFTLITEPFQSNDIHSVGKLREDGLYEVTVKSFGNNLCDNKFEVNGLYAKGGLVDYNSPTWKHCPTYIPVKPNTVYYVESFKYTGGEICVLGYTEIGKGYNTTVTRKVASKLEFTTPNDCKYIRLCFNTHDIYDIFLSEKSKFKGYYEEYVETKKTILLERPLEGIYSPTDNTTCDKLYISDNKLYLEKRVNCVEITESTNLYSININDSFNGIVIGKNSLPGLYFELINDEWDYGSYIRIEGIKPHCGDKALHFYENPVNFVILFDKSLSLEECKNILIGKKVYYSRRYEYETICLGNANEIILSTYDNNTNIVTESIIEPIIKCKVPVTLASQIEGNITVLENIRNKIQDINNITEYNNSLPVEITNNCTTIENTNYGNINNLSITGKSIVNILPNHNNLRLGLHDTLPVNINGEFSGILPNSNYYVFDGNKYWTGLRPNKTYTIKGFILIDIPNSVSEKLRFFYRYMDTNEVEQTKEIYMSSNLNSSNRLLDINISFTTNSTCSGKFGFHLFSTDKVTNIKGKLFVAEGDIRDINVDYFEGMEHVRDIILTSSNNLFNIDRLIYKHGLSFNSTNVGEDVTFVPKNTRCVIKLKCDPMTRYYFNSIDTVAVLQVDRFGKFIVDRGWSTGNFNILTDKRAAMMYVSIRNTSSNLEFNSLYDVLKQNIYISKKPQIYDTLSHSRNIEIEPLRSLNNDVRDTIEKINGKYCVIRRCGSVVLNGTENWFRNGDYLLYSNVVQSQVNPSNPNICYCLTSKFSADSYNKGIVNSTNTFAFHTNGNLEIKGTGHTVSSFKELLQNEPITLVYQLANYIVEPLDINLDLQLCDEFTNITVDSGPIFPNVKLHINDSLSNTVKNIIERISVLENKKYKLSKMLLDSTYIADSTSFTFDIARSTNIKEYVEYDHDLYILIKKYIKSREYKLEDIENMIDFYTLSNKFSYDMADELLYIAHEFYGVN